MRVVRRLDDYRGASRFTTWAYKFALLEAVVKLRRRAWQGREIPLGSETWRTFSSPHQRRVLVAIAIDGVPIDVPPERLESTRGALYKTLHDARRQLRKHLEESGLAPDTFLEETT